MTGEPFPCPNCGATDEWKADYYEAVWQTATVLVGENGPEVADYNGVTGTYDDPATEDEGIRCGCGHEIRFGTFKLVPETDPEGDPR